MLFLRGIRFALVKEVEDKLGRHLFVKLAKERDDPASCLELLYLLFRAIRFKVGEVAYKLVATPKVLADTTLYNHTLLHKPLNWLV